MCIDDASRQVENHSGKQAVDMPSDAWRLNDWYILDMYASIKYASTYLVSIHA